MNAATPDSSPPDPSFLPVPVPPPVLRAPQVFATPAGFDFLRDHGARRMRASNAPPFMAPHVSLEENEDNEDNFDAAPRALPRTTRDFEVAPEDWKPIRVSDCGTASELDAWSLRPRRFVDGKDVGRTVVWLQDSDGCPIPLRLSILGAVAVENDAGHLRRGVHRVEQVLTMASGCFDEEEVATFAHALSSRGIGLRSVPRPEACVGFEWERTAGRTRAESRRRMIELERDVMALEDGVPTLVDGRLDAHISGEAAYQTAPVIALVKSHHVQYFEGESPCWKALYALEPGERTPAFVIHTAGRKSYDVVSWYVRLCGSGGEMPNWGIVRLEVAREFFVSLDDASCLDRWSRLVCEYRCRDDGYSRSPVSIHPIVRGEEMLGAVFPPPERTVSAFYRAFGL